MPGIIRPITHTGITAELVRKSKRHTSSSGGFDPNADPVVIGLGASADAAGQVAVGPGATANGIYSVALGYGASAPYADGVAIGKDAVANGGDSTSIGKDATSESGGIAIGLTANASVDLAIAIGDSSAASGIDSVAIGPSATATRDYQIMLGNPEHFVEIPGWGQGLALSSPNGTRYMLTVSNAGALVITAAP